MATMTPDQRDAFLAAPRIAVFITLGPGGAPTAVPVWFEWDGETARLFTSRRSPKVGRIEADQRVALTIAEPAGVPEAWVTIEGTARIEEDGMAVAERLAPRYYPAEQAASTIESWRRTADDWIAIAIEPTRIRSMAAE